MAVVTHKIGGYDGGLSASLRNYYICDTDAEKPSSGMNEGDLCYTKDLDKFYVATSATTLLEIGGGGGSPPTGTGFRHVTGGVEDAASKLVDTADVNDGQITYAKMQNVSATSRALGRKTAGAGDVEELMLSELLDFIGSAAQGDILYRGAAAWARLGAGTSGQFLKTQGTGANPVWDTPGGGSGIAWREFVYLADIAGIAKTNIGTSFVEVGLASMRDKVDLTGFTDCRIVVGVNKVGTGTQSWKVQYSTDESAWSDLTPVFDDAGAAGEKLLVGAFGAIPAGAKADVWIRLVGKSTVSADDPVVKSCKLHVK